jgi:gas vesicle protein
MWNFLIGFAVGMTGALLMAPKSGRETRNYIGSAAAGSVSYMKRQTEELRESAIDMVERGKNVVNRQFERMAAATPPNAAAAAMYQR